MDEILRSALLNDLRQMIDVSRHTVAEAVSSEMSALYWDMGNRINHEILKNERAEYGQKVLPKISEQLTLEYGSGWSVPQLRHCIRFATVYPREIASTLWKQLNWSQIKEIMYIDEPLKRDFYAEMAKIERWGVRTLRERMNSLLFERTAISKKPEDTIANDLELLRGEGKLTPDMVFRDPYFLDYLGLHDTYSEKDLESAILVELQRFITELGTDFAFLARQKRITVDNRDYHIDLLFVHRRLRCLVVIELKLGEFEAAFKGQMELYLRWLAKHEMVEGENPPIGLILCSGKNSEHIELMGLDDANIRVAEYLTKLPDMKLLESKLRQSIKIANARLTKDI